MPNITIKQFARANNFAIHYGLRRELVIEAFQKTRKIFAAMEFADEEAEDVFYMFMRQIHA